MIFCVNTAANRALNHNARPYEREQTKTPFSFPNPVSNPQKH